MTLSELLSVFDIDTEVHVSVDVGDKTSYGEHQPLEDVRNGKAPNSLHIRLANCKVAKVTVSPERIVGIGPFRTEPNYGISVELEPISEEEFKNLTQTKGDKKDGR